MMCKMFCLFSEFLNDHFTSAEFLIDYSNRGSIGALNFSSQIHKKEQGEVKGCIVSCM